MAMDSKEKANKLWEKRSKDKASWNAYVRQYRKDNPDKLRCYELRRHYGITLEDYHELLEYQDGVCAICGNPPGMTGTGKAGTGNLAVDHCHDSNKVRGLLCTKCNLGIGCFRDDLDLFEKAVAYLIRNGGEGPQHVAVERKKRVRRSKSDAK